MAEPIWLIRSPPRRGELLLTIFWDGVPPRFQIRSVRGPCPAAADLSVETIRPDGSGVFSCFAIAAGCWKVSTKSGKRAGLIGSVVIASWAYGLIRDSGGSLLDMNPDRKLTESVRREIEADGDRLTDLPVWRIGPGHMGAVLSVVTGTSRSPKDYRSRLRRFRTLSHVTVEAQQAAQ